MTYNAPADYQSPPPGAGKGNGLAIAALVLGIIGCVLAITICLTWLGMLLGVVGVILGIVALVQAKGDPQSKRGMALTGTILSGAAILVGIIAYIVVFVVLDRAGGGLQNLADKTQVVAEATEEAESIADDARSAGVDEQTIGNAMARFMQEMGNIPFGADDTADASARAEAALQDLRETLNSAGTGGDAPDSDTGGGDTGNADDTGGGGA